MGTCEGFPTPTSSAAAGGRPQTSEEAEADKVLGTFGTGLPATCVAREETCAAGRRTTFAVAPPRAWITAGCQVISEGPCPVTPAGLRHTCTEAPRGTAARGLAMDLEFTDLEWAGPWVALAVGEVTIETPDIWILVVLRLACPGLVRAWEVRMSPCARHCVSTVCVIRRACVCACKRSVVCRCASLRRPRFCTLQARADRGADKACGESRGTQEILILVAAPLRINRAADRQRRWATRGAVSKTRSRISCSR